MNTKKIITKIASNTVAWIISIISLIPLLVVIFNSLKDSVHASDMNLKLPALPFVWENFSNVISKGKLATSFFNSTVYSVVSVALCTILATACAYALSRNRSKINNAVYMYIVLGIAMPVNYVALMKIMALFNFINSRLGIILLYTAMQLPFAVFLLHGFIAKVPVDLDEAAMLDGCSPLRLFFSIILPLLKPALATVIVLTFLNTWNEFVSPLYFLSNSDKWPMTLSVYNFFGMYHTDWNLICADIILTSLPVIIVYLLGQKHIVAGMTSGAVKG
jgi:raffinose/stachyose/melibiose transport system permease protein